MEFLAFEGRWNAFWMLSQCKMSKSFSQELCSWWTSFNTNSSVKQSARLFRLSSNFIQIKVFSLWPMKGAWSSVLMLRSRPSGKQLEILGHGFCSFGLFSFYLFKSRHLFVHFKPLNCGGSSVKKPLKGLCPLGSPGKIQEMWSIDLFKVNWRLHIYKSIFGWADITWSDLYLYLTPYLWLVLTYDGIQWDSNTECYCKRW